MWYAADTAKAQGAAQGMAEGIVVGFGHSERQDDGVGPYVAQRLCEEGLAAVVYEGEGSGLLDLWEGRPACLVIDAISDNKADAAAPGSLRLFTGFDDPGLAQASFVHSSHRMGLPEAIALGKALDRLPLRLITIGIVGTDFGFGDRLSPPVGKAAEHLVERLSAADDPFAERLLAELAGG